MKVRVSVTCFQDKRGGEVIYSLDLYNEGTKCSEVTRRRVGLK